MEEGWVTDTELELRLAGPPDHAPFTNEQAYEFVGTTIPSYLGTRDDPGRRRAEDLEVVLAWVDTEGWLRVRVRLVKGATA